MPTFTARYRTLNSSENRESGIFDFESEARLGSKANAHDARVRMLELYGNDALSWTIEKIEHKAKKAKNAQASGQLELDFRDPVVKHRARTKRGLV